MFSNQRNNYPVVRSFNDDDSFKPREILSKYLYHWPLFLIFLGVAFVGAIIYLKITPPVYEIKASLLIKEENYANPSRTGIALEELDISAQGKIVDNEIEVLKSRNLISTVVKDLQLWVDYQSNKKIGKVNIYGESPVRIIFDKVASDIENKQIIVFIKNDKSFFITEKDKEAKEYLFDNKVTNSLGTFKVEKTRLAKKYFDNSILVSFKDIDKVISQYQNSIEVALVNKKSPTISLALKDPNKQRGKDILNHLITVYNSATIAEKNRITKSTIDFIDNRLLSISKELNEVEGQSEKFRSSRGLIDITSESRIYLENAQNNDNKLNEVNVRLNVIDGIEQYVNSSGSNRNTPSTLGIDDPGLNSLIEKLTQLELEKDRLLATTPESNPIFVPINSQINSAKNAIRSSIKNIKSMLLNTKSKLKAFDSGFQSSISKIPGEEREFLSIKRQENIKQDLFLYLLKKREEFSLSYASTLADARVIDSAYSGPIKWPNKILILAVALLFGLGVPVVLLVIRGLFNDKIKGREVLEKESGIDVAGEINEVSSNNPLVIFDQFNIATIEQFRYLRTKVLALHNKLEKGRVTLITSSVAKEGKAFISSNLALTLASSGRKVILLDLDLRKDKIAKLFNLGDNEKGLSQFLQNEANKEEIIQQSAVHSNLNIITSGKSGITPTELLEKIELEILIDWLRLNYDDIILYTPPVRLAADAIILSKFSTVLLYVVKNNFTKKSFLKFVRSLQSNQELNKVNIVLNGSYNSADNHDFGKDYYPEEYQKRNLSFSEKLRAFFRRF